MKKYIVRRLLLMLPILLGVSLVVFLLIASLPGDAVTAHAAGNISQEKIEQNRRLLGLDQPLLKRYFYWLANACKGNLGTSTLYKQPVTKVIGTFVWNSFLLTSVSFFLQLLIAIPMGIIAAWKKYSWFDHGSSVIAFAGISMPSFFLAMILRYIFSIKLGILPLDGMETVGVEMHAGQHILDVIKHMILPVFTLTAVSMGTTMRYMRTAMLDVLHQDYIRTARAKGLSEKKVIYRHALRNAWIPIVTFLGGALPTLFAGALITETIFAWPGIGKVFYEAIGMRDYLLMMGIVMFLAILTMLGNLLSDILYSVADPRIRLK